MHNYVRNDTKKIIQKGNTVAVVKITEVALNNNFAKLPGSKVFSKLLYADQEYSSKQKSSNKNWECYEIRLGESKEVLIKVMIKGFIFGTKEVGECSVLLEETEGYPIKKPIVYEGNTVGDIEVSAYIMKENCTMSTQSTCNSLDMRDEYIKDSSHLELDFFKPMNFFSHFQEAKDKNFDVSYEEKSEQSMHDFIEKVSVKKNKILTERKELSNINRNLDIRAESLINQKYQLALESEKIKEERMKLQKVISQLNSDFYELKHDKFRARAHKKLVQRTKGRISENLNRLTKQKLHTKDIEYLARDKENLDYSVLGLSESVLPITNRESPVPEDNILESL